MGGFAREPVFEFFKFFVLEGKLVFDGLEGVFPELKLSESFADDLFEVFGVLLLLMEGRFGGLIGAFLVSDEVFVVLALFGEIFDLLAEGIDSLKEELIVVGGLFGSIFGAYLLPELLFDGWLDLLNSVSDFFLDFHFNTDDFLFEGKHFFLESFFVIKQQLISFLEFLNLFCHLIAPGVFVSQQFLKLTR